MLKKLVLALVATLFATQLFAHPAILGSIKGDVIDLKLFDHAISGSIGNILVLGNLNEETNASAISFVQEGHTFTAAFGAVNGRFGGGGLVLEGDTNQMKPSTIELRGINPMEKTITLHIDKKNSPEFNADLVFKITADDFINNHFINPTYTTTLPNGKVLAFKVADGQACYKFSTHLLHMIMSVYVQTL